MALAIGGGGATLAAAETDRTDQVPKPLILLLCLAAAPAFAQPLELPAGIGPGGAAYVDAVRGSGARTGVAYYDPGRPAPELRTDIEVAPPARPAEPAAASEPIPIDRWMVAVVFALVLLAVLLLAARFGGGRAASFARPPERGLRARAAAAPPAPAAGEPGPDGLEAIAGLADRRRALQVLLERALERAARANGRSLARSQTVRDVLRSLPATWPALPALQRIARQAEVVRFGGRALSEDAFRRCIEAARPIFESTRP